MGLAISKRLSELMGGTLTFESEPNRGSTFNVNITGSATLPKKKSSHLNNNTSPKILHLSKRILIIEGNSSLLIPLIQYR